MSETPPAPPPSSITSALAYRARGWSLVPVQRREKKPLVAWKHYQTAVPTNEKIEQWWSQYPDANIGIVTGRISDLIVVDIDTGADISGLHLPSTYTVRSGGGGGCHMYYRYPQSFEGHIETKAGIREHVDIRADGGLIVAPPSLHASGKHYTVDESCPSIDEIVEAPEWILEECMKGEKMGKQDTKTKKESKKEDSKKTKSKTDWKAFLKEKNGEGTRNDRTTKYVGKILASLPEELWDTAGWSSVQAYNTSHNTPPLDEHELSEIFASVRTMASENRKNGEDSEKNESSEKRGVADILLDLILPEVTLFKNQTNDGFIRVRCDDHFENLAMASKSCKQWLTRRYYDEYGSSLSPDTLSRVVNTLSAQAEYQGEQHTLDIRIVGDAEHIRYDIGSPSWECVSVDPFGWRVVP